MRIGLVREQVQCPRCSEGVVLTTRPKPESAIEQREDSDFNRDLRQARQEGPDQSQYVENMQRNANPLPHTQEIASRR